MILITADLHFNDKERDRYRHDYVDTILKEINKNRVDHLLILGDLTEEKNYHGSRLVNRIVDHIYRLAQLCYVTIIKGNHDYTSSDNPFFEFLGRLENVDWISDPQPGDAVNFSWLYLPHTHNYVEDWMGINVKNFDYVFTHNTFAGAKSESGVELEGIPRTVFSKKQTVVSGDVHVPQKLGPIEYVGAPYSVNFGDSYGAHMMLLDHYSGKKSYIPYEGPRKVMVDLPLGVPFRIEGLSEGDIVKVRVAVNADEFAKFQEYKDLVLAEFKEMGVTVHMVQPVFSKGGPMQTKRRTRRRSDEEVLEAYATAHGVRENVVKTGKRIMRRV